MSRVATDQEIVWENKYLFWVSEKLTFEEKSEKIEII